MTLEADVEMNIHRKIIILGINEIVRRELISLNVKGDHMPDEKEFGHIFADLAGVPSVILWQNIGHDELRVSVWWNYDHSKHPQADSFGNAKEQFLTPSPVAKEQHYRKFVGATVTAWLERKKGLYIHGTGKKGLTETYMRQSDKGQLQALPTPVPQGYRAEGKFHM